MADDWRALLQRAYEADGPTAVGAALGYSPATVIGVVKGTYGADASRVARRVVEIYGQDVVACPVLGAIPVTDCALHRRAPFAATNPLRVRLWKACRSCPHNPDATTSND